MERRGTALVTGVGRRRSIGAELALGLASDGWDVLLNYWAPYDDRLDYERGADDPHAIAAQCRGLGVRAEAVPADLADPEAPTGLVAAARELGQLRALVMSHCESVDSAIPDTTVESWDRHFAVNARASWLLIREFAAGAAAGGPDDRGDRTHRRADQRPHRPQLAVRSEQGCAGPGGDRGGRASWGTAASGRT